MPTQIFQRISPFGIAPVKNVHTARTCTAKRTRHIIAKRKKEYLEIYGGVAKVVGKCVVAR